MPGLLRQRRNGTAERAEPGRKEKGEIRMNRFMKTGHCSRGNSLPDGFAAWSRIEDLCGICGYNASEQFDLLRKLPEIYPDSSGRDPEDLAEEHPMRALAALVRRFLQEYPEAAGRLANTGRQNTHAGKRPGMAA